MVSVLTEDPGLARHLSARALAQASAEALAPLVRLQVGRQRFLVDEPLTHGHLGLLVLEGLIARHVAFGQIGATELLGPGDILRPWVNHRDHAEAVNGRWEVLARTRLAALDRDFANRVRPWPEIAAALLDRAIDRTDSQLLQSALRQTRRVDDRLLLALWHFAGRWGEVQDEHRTVSLPRITGEMLARIVGARRQSVSTALGALTDRGALTRRPDGTLIVHARPPQLDGIQTPQRNQALRRGQAMSG